MSFSYQFCGDFLVGFDPNDLHPDFKGASVVLSHRQVRGTSSLDDRDDIYPEYSKGSATPTPQLWQERLGMKLAKHFWRRQGRGLLWQA